MNDLNLRLRNDPPARRFPAVVASRDAWLDLLRAAAILMVLIYHFTQRWPMASPSLKAITEYGKYGVDLFFVLSGWLIGGLLWRERGKFGNVQIGRFVFRRMVRTVPPYLVALVVSYLGVRFSPRHEPFDWTYLCFLQNYRQRIPFFLVSWSLCVEEHFYLVMPVIALALVSRGSKWHIFILLAALLPMMFRAINSYDPARAPFGYSLTATHLRFEGLLLGVWAAFIRHCRADDWARLRRLSLFLVTPALVVAIAASMLPPRWEYATSYLAVALFFSLLLIAVVERRAGFVVGSRIVFWIASTSYSVYLVHASVLDVTLRVIQRMPRYAVLQICIFAIFIAIVGAMFYVTVERPSLLLRRKLVPPRER